MKIPRFLAFAVTALLVYSCSSDSLLNGDRMFMGDIRIEFQDLPPNAQYYLNQKYPDAEIRWIKMDDDGDTKYFYEVKLKNGREIYFNELGELVEDGFDLFNDDDIKIDPSNLPQPVLVYIATNYPGVSILHAEMEEDDDEPYQYEITLANGVELYFDAAGNLVKVDDDD